MRKIDKKEANISNGSIRRLARRAGVKRISKTVYGVVRKIVQDYLHQLAFESGCYASARNSTVISTKDVLCALRKQGRSIYGFHGI